jgi:hypothetical protein
MSEKELKLFVWEGDGVLRDYTSGMICVLAHDYDEAMKLIEKKYPEYIQSFPPTQYEIITKPEAFCCYGSS